MREDQIPVDVEVVDFKKQVEEVLVKDLGHKLSEAQRLVKEAMLRNPNISTPEELFEEVYRGQKEITFLNDENGLSIKVTKPVWFRGKGLRLKNRDQRPYPIDETGICYPNPRS